MTVIIIPFFKFPWPVPSTKRCFYNSLCVNALHKNMKTLFCYNLFTTFHVFHDICLQGLPKLPRLSSYFIWPLTFPLHFKFPQLATKSKPVPYFTMFPSRRSLWQSLCQQFCENLEKRNLSGRRVGESLLFQRNLYFFWAHLHFPNFSILSPKRKAFLLPHVPKAGALLKRFCSLIFQLIIG